MVKEFVQEDYDVIRRWYAQHGKPAPPYDVLPTYGLIDTKIACGFLITTDSSVGILDFYISNPISKRSDRSYALDKITSGLIDHGKRLGLRYFQCSTQVEAIRERAKEHGFEYVGEFSLFSRYETKEGA